ncbi:putative membrane protein [Heracleum sosnowskyi]|uniref:Membrane protein n=1 Tax=Heracleum sosnowskyi TaxID=360622 RepID=A0AAD8JH81_9APIA|nr:putative membrane protein [Heracleum sosnowskyi]
MDDLRGQGPQEGKYYDIRLIYIPGAIIIGVVGILVDFVVISFAAFCKFPYMLFKGWHRLFQDCIGREGPFLETICVPIAGLAILLWPLAVVGALLASILSSIVLGAYAAVIVYQESSLRLGFCYIVASLSIYDEYSNDVLDMPEGSCFPRFSPQYRKKTSNSGGSSNGGSLRKPDSFRKVPSRSISMRTPLVEVKPLELIDNLFKECKRYGEVMVSEGLITKQDIEDAKSNKGNGKAICTGLAAYGILQSLLRSAKYNSPGILLADNATEITPSNRPRDVFFDWFLNPLLIIKEQIKAEHLSPSEEAYLGKLVLLTGNPERLKNSDIGTPPESERKRAELDGLARRLHGITKSISRYPTYRRRFDSAIKTISDELAKKSDSSSREGSGSQKIPRSKSTFTKIFSQKSFKGKPSEADIEAQPVGEREILVQ